MKRYLEYQIKVMKRWCRLYSRTYEDFIEFCAARFREKHQSMINL